MGMCLSKEEHTAKALVKETSIINDLDVSRHGPLVLPPPKLMRCAATGPDDYGEADEYDISRSPLELFGVM